MYIYGRRAGSCGNCVDRNLRRRAQVSYRSLRFRLLPLPPKQKKCFPPEKRNVWFAPREQNCRLKCFCPEYDETLKCVRTGMNFKRGRDYLQGMRFTLHLLPSVVGVSIATKGTWSGRDEADGHSERDHVDKVGRFHSVSPVWWLIAKLRIRRRTMASHSLSVAPLDARTYAMEPPWAVYFYFELIWVACSSYLLLAGNPINENLFGPSNRRSELFTVVHTMMSRCRYPWRWHDVDEFAVEKSFWT